MDFKLSLEQAKESLNQSPKEFLKLMETGSMEVELYKPHQIDKQLPHNRDEIYIIAQGSGVFEINAEKTNFQKGDLLFVPSGAEHRFLNFTDDFYTWVIFYGPISGEQGELKNYLIKEETGSSVSDNLDYK